MKDLEKAFATIIDQNETGAVVELEVASEIAYPLMDLVSGYQYEIKTHNDRISSKDSYFDKTMFMFRNMNEMGDYKLICFKVARLLIKDYVKLGVESINDILVANRPHKSIDATFNPLMGISMLCEEIAEEKRAEVRRHISVESKKFEVIYSDINQELIDRMINDGGVYVLTHAMGEGKTFKGTVPMFNQACEKGLMPVGLSPKKVLASMICNDERNYQKISLAELAQKEAGVEVEQPKGVFGVINSIATHPRFKSFANNNNVLIAEEHEEIKSQCVGRAVGKGSMLERAELLKAYMDMIKRHRTVTLMDAMFSESQAEMIAKETGRKVIIVKSNKERKGIKVNFLSEAENVARANRVLEQKGNVLAFCDGSNKGEKSKFNETYFAMTSNASSHIAITANTVTERKDDVEFINNLPTELSKYQLAMVSPVINSGVSIETGHADSVHFFGNQVVPVKAVIQTLRRDRKATEINVSFANNVGRINTNIYSLVSNEMNRDSSIREISDELFDSYMSNHDVRNVASIMIEENLMRVDYEVNLIIALRELGFEVNFDSDNEEEGKAQKSQGREIEKAERVTSIVKATGIAADKAAQIRSKNYITNQEKFQLAKFEMKDFYKKEVTPELVEFDKKGKTREIISNHLIARGKNNSGVTTNAKRVIINKLMETININPITLEGSYTKVDADKFIKMIKNDKVELGKREMDMEDVFGIAFNMSLPKGHSTTVVGKLLKTLFKLDVEKGAQIKVNGKRTNPYMISQESKETEIMQEVKRLRKSMEDDAEHKEVESLDEYLELIQE